MLGSIDMTRPRTRSRQPRPGAVAIAAALLALAVPAQAQRLPTADWSGDGPFRLSELARAAVERNRDVLDARYQLGVAQRQVSEAWSDVYPASMFRPPSRATSPRR